VKRSMDHEKKGGRDSDIRKINNNESLVSSNALLC